MKLEGKVAIVTGGGQGIGRATCLALAEEGASVVIGDVDIEPAKNVAEEIKKMGRQALVAKADVTKSGEINDMVETTLREFGKIDILVNNAGGSAQQKASEFRFSEEETWNFVIGRNLMGTLICTRAVINHMIERKSGKLINIASATGVMGGVWQADYTASKAGIIGFSKALAKEVGRYGVYVNCVSPCIIRTPAVERAAQAASSEVLDQYNRRRIIDRYGEPEEVAKAVIFLASDDSNYTTGHNLFVDGGVAI